MEYKKLFQEEQSVEFENKHPEDQFVTSKTVDGLEAILKYYMVPAEAEKFFQDVADGKDEETLTIRLDDETHQKVIEAAIYSAINNYLQEQKDAVQRQIDLGNAQP